MLTFNIISFYKIAVYEILANIITIVHFFILLINIFGILITLKFRFFKFIHITSLSVTGLAMLFGYACPLTYLEEYFRSKDLYMDSFIIHYISKILYPDIRYEYIVAGYVILLITSLYFYIFIIK